MVRLLNTNVFVAVFVGFLTLPISPASLNAGVLIVDWGGNYVTSTQDLQGKNTFFDNTDIDVDGDATPDSIGGRLFSETTPMNPTSGYSGKSGTFYGGAITGHSNNTSEAAFDEFAIQNQGPNDGLHTHLSHAGHLHDMHMAMYWDQADFLATTGPAVFDGTSYATIEIGPSPVENISDAELRMLVRDSFGNYWLSDTSFTNLNSNTTYTWDSGNQGFSTLSDGLWAPYDPNAGFPKTPGPGTSAAGSDLRFDPSAVTFIDKKFTDISAVGFFFENDVFHNNLDFHIKGFEVNAAVAVPEPSTVTLLGVTALGLLGYGRRKRKLNRAV